MASLFRSRVLLSRTPLALSLMYALCTPAFAAAADGIPGNPSPATDDQPQDIEAVTVVGQRYLPEYQARKTRSATKTDTDLLDVPQAVTVVTDKLIADGVAPNMPVAVIERGTLQGSRAMRTRSW